MYEYQHIWSILARRDNLHIMFHFTLPSSELHCILSKSHWKWLMTPITDHSACLGKNNSAIELNLTKNIEKKKNITKKSGSIFNTIPWKAVQGVTWFKTILRTFYRTLIFTYDHNQLTYHFSHIKWAHNSSLRSFS